MCRQAHVYVKPIGMQQERRVARHYPHGSRLFFGVGGGGLKFGRKSNKFGRKFLCLDFW
jgi:hypothetical protein